MNDEELTALKKQFAFELYLQTQPHGLEHVAVFEIAQALARRIYPFDPTTSAALRIAAEWVKDPAVIDMFLKLKNGSADDRYLPTKAQFVMAICDRLDRISEEIGSLKRGSEVCEKANRLRRSFIELSTLVADCL
ncbi:hypothetical protein CTTA_4883 [Comamonas testosteroni]|uniref:Uncharacterized protein n=1 Tax=Comamonas testosteroni TaxID=285 RepID=A0A5A7MJ75_COMTE|nr:hypothetical protein [Comamonas testosteroni]GEQ77878.1 hypothetical protein CTTA_4883 [Comamonas testosteroni]